MLLHELIHAAVGCKFGHGKEFSQVAHDEFRAMCLECMSAFQVVE